MTDSQRIQLRAIIDLNWELSQEKDITKLWEKGRELNQMKKTLRDDMGHEEYDHFMEMGRQMFLPKK